MDNSYLNLSPEDFLQKLDQLGDWLWDKEYFDFFFDIRNIYETIEKDFIKGGK